jgi:hypothetical protein
MTPDIKRIRENFFRKKKDSPIIWQDIKHIEFQDLDKIQIGFDEGYYSENNSWGPHYFVNIERWRDETEEEAKIRKNEQERDKKWARERRYETYLKLRKEFESDEKK